MKTATFYNSQKKYIFLAHFKTDDFSSRFLNSV